MTVIYACTIPFDAMLLVRASLLIPCCGRRADSLEGEDVRGGASYFVAGTNLLTLYKPFCRSLFRKKSGTVSLVR